MTDYNWSGGISYGKGGPGVAPGITRDNFYKFEGRRYECEHEVLATRVSLAAYYIH